MAYEINPLNNPYFGTMDRSWQFGKPGSGFSQGNADGSGVYDFGLAGLDDSSFFRAAQGSGDNQGSASIDPQALAQWLSQNGYNLMDTGPTNGFYGSRYVQDAAGSIVGAPQTYSNDDRNFWTAALLAGGLVGSAIAAPATVGGTAATTSATDPLAAYMTSGGVEGSIYGGLETVQAGAAAQAASSGLGGGGLDGFEAGEFVGGSGGDAVGSTGFELEGLLADPMATPTAGTFGQISPAASQQMAAGLVGVQSPLTMAPGSGLYGLPTWPTSPAPAQTTPTQPTQPTQAPPTGVVQKTAAEKAAEFALKNPKLVGSLLGAAGGGSDGGGGGEAPYTGPMPTITRGNWSPTAAPQYMQQPNYGLLQPAGTKTPNSGLHQYMGLLGGAR